MTDCRVVLDLVQEGDWLRSPTVSHSPKVQHGQLNPPRCHYSPVIAGDQLHKAFSIPGGELAPPSTDPHVKAFLGAQRN